MTRFAREVKSNSRALFVCCLFDRYGSWKQCVCAAAWGRGAEQKFAHWRAAMVPRKNYAEFLGG
jgi:hypothetical protein